MATFVPQGPLSLLPSMDSSSVKAAMVSDDLFLSLIKLIFLHD